MRVLFSCLVCIGAIFGWALRPATAADTIAAILANPSAYDGKPVEILGTVKESQKFTVVAKSIPFSWFRTQFCEAATTCIFAIGFSPVKFDPQQTMRMRGTYWVNHEGPNHFKYDNRIELKDVVPADSPSPASTGK